MLKIIDIRIAEICKTANDFMAGGQEKIVVQSYAYHTDKIIDDMKEAKTNIDQYFSRLILHGLSTSKLKSKILFFFVPLGEVTIMCAADNKQNIDHYYLSKTNAYFESGQEYLHNNARPFMYWDGKNVIRIYSLPEEYSAEKYYFNDFGSLYGLLTAEADEEYYNELKNEPGESWDYSIVPRESEEIITYKEKKLVLSHSFYRIIK